MLEGVPRRVEGQASDPQPKLKAKTVERGGVTWWKKSQRVVVVGDLDAVASVVDDVLAVDTYQGSGLRGQGVWVEECGGT